MERGVRLRKKENKQGESHLQHGSRQTNRQSNPIVIIKVNWKTKLVYEKYYLRPIYLGVSTTDPQHGVEDR